MKTFYEMLQFIEQDDMPAAEQGPEQGLGNEAPARPEQPQNPQPEQELKHYMFFSNLKSIKEKVEAMLAMDPNEVDGMLDDGHDWASDHISTSRDDVEEVHNWLMGEKK